MRERTHYSWTAAYKEPAFEEQSFCINDLCIIQNEAKKVLI